jgi:hypothetical protein
MNKMDGYRGVAQLVEHRSPKPEVAGSSPATPTFFHWHYLRSIPSEQAISLCKESFDEQKKSDERDEADWKYASWKPARST